MSKTIIDLMREYVRVSDMCEAYNKEHNTDVKPWECVRNRVEVHNHGLCTGYFSNHPNFNNYPNAEIAVSILEAKPVFVGDVLWHVDGYEVIATDMHKNLNPELLSWTPLTPKRTFMLNGVELPCPINDSNGCRLDWLGMDFYFETIPDRNLVATEISSLLKEARDQEAV